MYINGNKHDGLTIPSYPDQHELAQRDYVYRKNSFFGRETFYYLCDKAYENLKKDLKELDDLYKKIIADAKLNL